MEQPCHSFRFPTIAWSGAVVVAPLHDPLIARHLRNSVSSIAGLNCDAGDGLALEQTPCGC